MARSFLTRVAYSVPPLLAFAFSAFVCLWGISRSPDVITDEATYGYVGQQVANYNALSFGVGAIVVHPPLFFLASGGWLLVTGHNDGSITSAITTIRVLNGAFSLGAAVVVALLARGWLRAEVRFTPRVIVPLVMVLVATDGFLLRFGRTALIEAMALFLAVLALLVAWGLRHAPAHVYVAGTGIAMGLALLTKQPALFIVGAPLLAAVLGLRWRAIGRELAALVVGLIVFASFGVWAYQSGNGDSFYYTQLLNARRLAGLVQVTGLNRESSQAAGGASASVKDTFAQFAGAYVLFAVGAVAVVVLAWHLVRDRRRGSLGVGAMQVLALGVLSYAFLAYSVLFGQSNQQFTIYTVPGAAVLCAWFVLRRSPERPRRRIGVGVTWAATVVVGLGLVVSMATGVIFYPLRDDNATARVEDYIAANIPVCAPVNTTGNAKHWSYTMRTNPVTDYESGPQALRAGTHLFLVSPRDAKYGYGPSSPEFNKWIEDNGRKLFEAPTNVYGNVSLWQVGSIPQPRESDPAQCVISLAPPADRRPAPALRALGFIAAFVGGVLVLAWVTHLFARRRQPAGRHSVDASPPPD